MKCVGFGHWGTVGDKLVKKGWVRKGLDLEEQGVNYWGGREAVNTDAQGFALLSDLGSFCSLWTREAGKKKKKLIPPLSAKYLEQMDRADSNMQ